ncbi:MAG TPA: hypothetical protein VK689_08790 [Armatimonadota bacterium]|nr:hypothetical protein [Armatimonadota bacterium]
MLEERAGTEAFEARTSVIRMALRRCPMAPVKAVVEVFRSGMHSEPAFAAGQEQGNILLGHV